MLSSPDPNDLHLSTRVSTQGPPATSFRDQASDLQDHLRSVWQRKWLILFVVLAAGAATYVLAERHHAAALRNKQYTTSTEVYIEVATPASLVSAGATTPTPPAPPDGQQMSDMAALF